MQIRHAASSICKTTGHTSRPSVYICKAEDEECAQVKFDCIGLNINYSRGEQYLGGYVGRAKEKDKWIKDKVERWVQDVQVMASIAGKYPQEAEYIGFVKCKQQESRVTIRSTPCCRIHCELLQTSQGSHTLQHYPGSIRT